MAAILSFATSASNFGVITNLSKTAAPLHSRSRISMVKHHQHSAPLFVPEVESAVDILYPEFRAVDNLVARNSSRVLKAFQNARVGSHHFSGCTGYGHEEAGGREALDQAFAEIFGAESAIVRSQFFSGTHAITCALFAFLRPGDELLAVAGAPYDTLEEVIGIRDGNGLGSLKDFGIKYREVELADDGGLDWDALEFAIKPQTKCALIQRSCGYSWRKSLSVDEISRAIHIIKTQNPNCLVMVDNCYGEFTEAIEPPMVGADLIAGSLIKNPGGTIAPCGGYVAGKEKWVKAAAARLSAPGLGVDCGSTPGDIMRTFFQGLYLSPQMVGEAIKTQNPNCLVMVDNCYGEFTEAIEPPMVGADLIAGSLIKNPGGTIAPCGGYVAGKEKWVKAAAARLSAPGLGVDCGSTPGDIMRTFFQGLYLSPQMVGEAIKGGLLIAEVMSKKGYKVQPLPRVPRHDIVQAVQLGSRERLLAFCEAVQRSSPVSSYTKPIAGVTAGYASEVIFADGTFIDGSTSELSCDGPLREPFTVFCQGGTHWTQWGLVLGEVLKSL